MKSSRALLAVVSMCLLLAALSVQADVLPNPAAASRGVYLNGAVYRVVIAGGKLTMQTGAPQNAALPITPVDRTFVQSKEPVSSSFSICQFDPRSYGGGLAVFNGKIYYAYTGFAPGSTYGCAHEYFDYSSPDVFVAAFDPAANSWDAQPREIPAYIPQERRFASGAALTVFEGRLYLFAGNSTFTTGNPEEGWSYDSAGLSAPGYEPLDALTIYRPNAEPGESARILVLYGRQVAGNACYYSGLASGLWDGKTRTSLVPTSISNYNFTGRVSLQTGTARNVPYTVKDNMMRWASFQGTLESPAVQLFAVFMLSNVSDRGYVVHYEYNVAGGTWRLDSSSYGADLTPAADLWTYTWFQKRCDDTNPSAQSLHQFIVVNYLTMTSTTNGNSTGFAYDSDNLVPQNRDPERDLPISCTDPGGTATPTGSMAVELARHYWTLVGVVLGSPPFAVNHLPKDAEVTAQDLSNLDYASEKETGISHSQEWGNQVSFSAGLEVSAGFFGVGEVSNSFDIGYKHAWESTKESESTGTVGKGEKMGTNTFRTEAAKDDDPNLGLGKYGWALFNGPTIKVQDFAVYGYDYDYHTGTGGTYMNQDLMRFGGVAGRSSMRVYGFNLKDPSKGDIPGLMAGMPGVMYHPDTDTWGFPESTDLAGWHDAQDWETNSRSWEVKLGRGTYSDVAPMMGYGAGHNGSIHITNSEKTITSEGQTSELDVSNTFSISSETGFGGVRADFKVGYESTFKTSTKDTTALTTDVKAELKMGPCGIDVVDRTDCIGLLEVQPFVLLAKDSTAPWIPETFRGQRPWAITWQVDRADPETASSEEVAAKAAVATVTPGLTFGRSRPPRNAFGRVVSGYGGGDHGNPLSHYTVEGGRMWWVDGNGVETRIPMTAETFQPSKGVSFQIGRFSWTSAGARGFWTRGKYVWTFTPSDSVTRDRVTVRLDFSDGTFDLQVEEVDFEGSIRAGEREVTMKLIVNGLYSFRTVMEHDFDVMWRWTQSPVDDNSLQVTSFYGRYDNASESGNMSLSGPLPKVLPAFGDMALKLNGRTLLLPLLSMDGFREAFDNSGLFTYENEGLSLRLDFRNKTWSAEFNDQAFQKLLALRWGGSRIQLNVGGRPWYSREHPIVDFTADLTLHK